MKTKEFIKKVKEMGYGVEIIRNTLFIKGEYGGFHGMCYFQLEKHIQIDTSDLKLAKLCVEYAETPIAEREEEKKYTVILPDPKNTIRHKFGIAKHNGEIRLGYYQVTWFREGLTEAEIKRNHEYLWQFAKEVTE